MTRIFGILIVLALCWPAAGRSAAVSGLYQAEVPVADQSEASQKQGVASALANVLIKLTGDRKVMGRAGASRFLERPEQYVQQYQFQKKAEIVDNQLTGNERLYLWVSFNADILDKAIKNNNIPQWGKIRPSTLIWLVAPLGADRKFIGLDDEKGYAAIMDTHAQQRGVPVIYPLFDSVDRQVIKESDVAGGFMDPVKQASQRYAPDVILAGNLTSVSSTSWVARWTMLLTDQPVAWSTEGATPALALQAGVDRLADELATRFVHASTQADESGFEIEVKDINSFDQYAKVLKYLSTLNSVTSVEVKSLAPGSVVYSVSATGGELAVERAIALGKTLESLDGEGGPYRLR